MVSVRKRKMARSSVKKQTSQKKKNFNPNSNPIIKKYWDESKTAKQNYQNLGLTMKLGKVAGGIELKIHKPKIKRDNDLEDLEISDDSDDYDDSNNQKEEGKESSNKNIQQLSIKDQFNPNNILKGTAKIQRDENGKVIQVIYGTMEPITLNNDDYEEEEESHASHVIAELEKMAAKPKKETFVKLNDVEVARLERLERKYKDDYEKMKWDQKLNPFQLSVGDLKKNFLIFNKQRSL